MKKIRCSLATIVLLTLGGLSLFQGMGSTSLANAASSHYTSSVSAPSVVGKSLAFKLGPPCGSAIDC
jgi:hypothetical protein